MQSLLYLWLVTVLLQIHNLLEVDLRTSTLRHMLTRRLLVVTYTLSFLCLFGAQMLNAREGKH